MDKRIEVAEDTLDDRLEGGPASSCVASAACHTSSRSRAGAAVGLFVSSPGATGMVQLTDEPEALRKACLLVTRAEKLAGREVLGAHRDAVEAAVQAAVGGAGERHRQDRHA